MSFKFEFKIDYEKLTTLLDTFLKSHSDELTSIMGRCLVLQPSDGAKEPIQQPTVTTPTTTTVTPSSTDHKVDNRPLIGDEIPEDPLQNLFTNPNANTTRYQDRNNPNIKKGFRL